MERTAVTSRNIVSIGYDPSSSTLEIEFKDATYQYYGVPADIYEGLLQAPSKGSFFAQYIRRAGYGFAKV
jgi:hypothetical protein